MDALTNQDLILAGVTENLGSAYKKQAGKLEQLIANNMGASKNRKHFLERLASMPQEIVDKLLSGEYQLADAYYYSTRSVGAATSVNLFKEDDTKAVGFRNVDKARLAKDRPFVLSAAQLSYHKGSAAITASNINVFTPIGVTAEIYNGEWQLRKDGKMIYEELPIGSTFFTGLHPSDTTVPAMTEDTDASAQAAYTLRTGFAYGSNRNYGLYELDNPKIIEGDKRIELDLNFGAALSAASGFEHHAFKVGLIGTTVRPS